MAWSNAPQQNGMQNMQPTQTDGEKKSLRIGRIYAIDSKIDVGMCRTAKGGFYVTISITSGVKNPATGQTSYENGTPMERPSMLLNAPQCAAILKAVTSKDGSIKAPSELSAPIMLDSGVDSKMTLTPMGNSITLSLDSQKRGSRSATIPAINLGSGEFNGAWEVFMKYIEFGYLKLVTNKLDPDEFGNVNIVEDASNNDVPFN